MPATLWFHEGTNCSLSLLVRPIDGMLVRQYSHARAQQMRCDASVPSYRRVTAEPKTRRLSTTPNDGALKDSLKEGEEKPVDERYEQWIP